MLLRHLTQYHSISDTCLNTMLCIHCAASKFMTSSSYCRAHSNSGAGGGAVVACQTPQTRQTQPQWGLAQQNVDPLFALRSHIRPRLCFLLRLYKQFEGWYLRSCSDTNTHDQYLARPVPATRREHVSNHGGYRRTAQYSAQPRAVAHDQSAIKHHQKDRLNPQDVTP